MSKPFFIWTMRRTGGTPLTKLLMEMSEHKKIQHEPFNRGRTLDFVSIEFEKQVDVDEEIDISLMLKEVFSEKPLIKHCYEIFNMKFNKILINFIKNQEYRHIFLLRKDEKSRILSLLLALQTKVWGKHGSEKVYDLIHRGEKTLENFDIDRLKKEQLMAINKTKQIKELLKNIAIPYKAIYFEDLYTGENETRRNNLYDLFEYLEFEQEIIKSHENMIYHILFNRSQKSNTILPYIPNIKEAEQVVEKINNNAA